MLTIFLALSIFASRFLHVRILHNEPSGTECRAGIPYYGSHEGYGRPSFAWYSVRYFSEGHSRVSPRKSFAYRAVLWIESIGVERGVGSAGRAVQWTLYFYGDSGQLCRSPECQLRQAFPDIIEDHRVRLWSIPDTIVLLFDPLSPEYLDHGALLDLEESIVRIDASSFTLHCHRSRCR